MRATSRKGVFPELVLWVPITGAMCADQQSIWNWYVKNLTQAMRDRYLVMSDPGTILEGLRSLSQKVLWSDHAQTYEAKRIARHIAAGIGANPAN